MRINEVNTGSPEFVEIYNENNILLNLSEWQIKDNTHIDEIVCGNITNCTLLINVSYFIIIANDTDISDITSEGITYFYVDDSTIGNNLANEDNITFFNSTFSTNFSWGSSGNSWQFCSTSWVEATPTPGQANNCSSSEEEEDDEEDIYVKMEWDEDEIINGGEFEIKIKAYNLEDEKYDLKVYITPEDNDTIISETYDEEDERWMSSTYFLSEVIEGDGDESVNLKLRIDSEYDSFEGDAEIIVKIRDSDEDVLDSEKEIIEILEGEDEEETIGTSEEESESGDIIKLNQAKNIKTDDSEKVYKSRTQYIKEYAIYGFALFLIAIIIILIKRM